MLGIIAFTCFMLNSSSAIARKIPLRTHLRVLDGRDITPGEYPYAVTLYNLEKDYYGNDYAFRCCTGSMIAERWTLTAAHCVNEGSHEEYYVWYGDATISPLITKLYSIVLKIYLHPSNHLFNKNELGHLDNDISLLRVKEVNVKSYGRLSAVDHTTMIGLPVTYVGGGGTNKPGDDELRPLQVGEAAIITCDKKFKDSTNTKYLICITPKCSNRLHMGWYGDSGGPLIHDSKIIGVYALVDKSNNMSFMGYAPVSSYIDWISNVMRSTD